MEDKDENDNGNKADVFDDAEVDAEGDKDGEESSGADRDQSKEGTEINTGSNEGQKKLKSSDEFVMIEQPEGKN